MTKYLQRTRKKKIAHQVINRRALQQKCSWIQQDKSYSATPEHDFSKYRNFSATEIFELLFDDEIVL